MWWKEKKSRIYSFEGLASLAVAEDQPEVAARLFAWADEMRWTIGNPRSANEQADVDRDLAAIRLQLDEAAMQAAEAIGKTMTLDEAVAYALSEKKQ